MAGTIIADYIRADANKISLNVGNTVIASINASGILSNTGSIIVNASGQVPNTAITGTMTQAQIGTGISTTGPAFSAYKASNQSYTGGTYTKITFGTEEFDTANCYDSSTNFRFTPNVAGYYQVSGQIAVSGYSNRATAYLYKNGSVVRIGLANTGNATNDDSTNITALVYLNGTTDYIELYLEGNNSLTVNGNLGTYFQAYLARAT